MPVRALRGGPVLARACDALPCPKIEEPIGAFVSSWEIAEDCLQQQYKKRFPNNAVGFNKDWVGVPGVHTSKGSSIASPLISPPKDLNLMRKDRCRRNARVKSNARQNQTL